MGTAYSHYLESKSGKSFAIKMSKTDNVDEVTPLMEADYASYVDEDTPHMEADRASHDDSNSDQRCSQSMICS